MLQQEALNFLQMNLIVRVKRRRSQESSDTLWVVDDSAAGPQKKRANTARELAQSLTGLSTADSTGAEREAESDGVSGGRGGETSAGRVFLRRVQTVDLALSSGAADMDKQTLSASENNSSVRTGKRGRADDTDADAGAASAATDGTGADAAAGGSSSATTRPVAATHSHTHSHCHSVLVTNGKKVIRSQGNAQKFLVVDMAQMVMGASVHQSSVSTPISPTSPTTATASPTAKSPPSRGTPVMKPATR